MSLTDDVLEQVGRLFKENAELRERVEQLASQRDEWHRQNGLLRGERDAATARAEQAEAALAEMRERLGTSRDEWANHYRSDAGVDYYNGPLESVEEARQAFAQFTGWRLVTRVVGEWRDANTVPHTALERAADGQGVREVRCGSECSEGHTYEPGSCEAAIDSDEAIAQNHTDAAHDWGDADA